VTIAITAVSAAAYLGVSLFWMRYLYGRWRAKSIDGWPTLGADYFDRNESGFVMLGAGLTGLAWPLTLPTFGTGLLLARWMATTTTKSGLEQRDERNALQQRISELERELGIGGQR
jgi:hypothetical protein